MQPEGSRHLGLAALLRASDPFGQTTVSVDPARVEVEFLSTLTEEQAQHVRDAEAASGIQREGEEPELPQMPELDPGIYQEGLETGSELPGPIGLAAEALEALDLAMGGALPLLQRQGTSMIPEQSMPGFGFGDEIGDAIPEAAESLLPAGSVSRAHVSADASRRAAFAADANVTFIGGPAHVRPPPIVQREFAPGLAAPPSLWGYPIGSSPRLCSTGSSAPVPRPQQAFPRGIFQQDAGERYPQVHAPDDGLGKRIGLA